MSVLLEVIYFLCGYLAGVLVGLLWEFVFGKLLHGLGIWGI